MWRSCFNTLEGSYIHYGAPRSGFSLRWRDVIVESADCFLQFKHLRTCRALSDKEYNRLARHPCHEMFNPPPSTQPAAPTSSEWQISSILTRRDLLLWIYFHYLSWGHATIGSVELSACQTFPWNNFHLFIFPIISSVHGSTLRLSIHDSFGSFWCLGPCS